MATGSCPAWMDQVLFDLQDPGVAKNFSSWEKEFLPSLSTQYSNWKASTSNMSFATPKQRGALLAMYQKHFPERHKNLSSFQPFDE